jgi:esterase
VKLYHRKLGDGDPVLILHGLFGFSDNWMTIARGLKDHWQIFLLDLRNHGRSPHSPVFDYAVMVEDVYEFLTDLNLKRVSLIGHSMGGIIAMNFALEYPHRVDKLAVIDIAPKEYPIRHQEIMDALNAIDLRQIKSRQEADEQLAGFIGHNRIRRFLLKNLYITVDGTYAWRLNLKDLSQNLSRIGQGSPFVRQVRPFANPSLFLRGGASDYLTAEDEPLIKRYFPASRIQTIPDTTHWLHAEKPEAVLAHLKSFLQSNGNN